MAGLGFKDFQVGEVLTSSDVDGYLMQQSVMRFADSGARGSALGTAVGTGVPLAEGMVSYLDDANTVQVYSGTAWFQLGGYTATSVITATDTSWPVPTLAHPIVKVTVIGAGGGGGGAGNPAAGTGGAGGTTTFGSGEAWAVSASGGNGGKSGTNTATVAANAGLSGGNGGQGGTNSNPVGQSGQGGLITVGYVNLSGISTVNVQIGAGGAGGSAPTYTGMTGGRGEVVVEYVAG